MRSVFVNCSQQWVTGNISPSVSHIKNGVYFNANTLDKVKLFEIIELL